MIEVDENDVLELIFWARRYCDGRATYAPTSFNRVYDKILNKYPGIITNGDTKDKTLMKDGEYWPYAQDGMYNPETGDYEARSKIYKREE